MTQPTDSSLLEQLQESLLPHAHGIQALKAIQAFLKNVPKTQARADLFNSSGALVMKPIQFEEAVQVGAVAHDADPFLILSGDIVTTDTAYSLGERIIQSTVHSVRPKFIVASPTCDLVPGRKRTKCVLYEVQPILKPLNPDEQVKRKSEIAELLGFKKRRYMYLPPLPCDPPNVIANVVSFDDPAIVRLEDLILAERVASLSPPGWCIFGALLRINLTREGDSEMELRTKFKIFLHSKKEELPGILA